MKKRFEQEVRDIHGDKFFESMREEFKMSEQEMADEDLLDNDASYDERTFSKEGLRRRLLDILCSPLLFWIAGFIDGIFMVYLLKFLGIL